MDRASKISLLELYRPEPSTIKTKGHTLLKDASVNKGLSFTSAERVYLGLDGLMPQTCITQSKQCSSSIKKLRAQPNDMARFIFLEALKERDEKLFYRLMREYPDELLPIVYTPTVGDACLQFEYRYQKALFISIKDNNISKIYQILSNWKYQDVRAIVVTDGERILGLGDLGIQGIEIPVGKLALYVALGGVQPRWCLPIQLDVGTDNEEFLSNPDYVGLKQKRVRGAEYENFIENFMKACRKRFGQNVLIQFEDFGKNTAYKLLERFRNNYCTFNDDIQGTASVSVAGLIAAARITGQKISDMKFLFHGAGTAAVGCAELLVEKMYCEGLSKEKARERIFLVKTDGLIIKKRQTLSEQQIPFAKDGPDLKDLYEIVKAIKPTAIIGVSTIRGAFTEQIIREMSTFNKHPVIFALSNPTSKSECTAIEAYNGTNGSALFASGSPFPPVQLSDGRNFRSGQCNNAYIFPGVALGIVLFKVANIPDKLFLIAALKLAECVSDEELSVGCLYPDLKKVPEISIKIAVAIGEECYKDGSAKLYPEPEDKELFVRAQVYNTEYEEFLPLEMANFDLNKIKN
uniref:Malic enzyme n=1 Tax=Meloidogyne enterolobii TaxID=390850 RepID=A0A6V7WBI4_MELEN|nr:unnamed protein product [Meloidogyne enterolobii]